MKKLLFILLFPVMLFSQEKKSDPIVDLKLLEFYQKQEVESYQVRDVLKEATEKILSKSSDSTVIQKCNDYLNYLKNIKVPEGVLVDLNKASKEDFKNFTQNQDKFNKTITITHKRLDYKKMRLELRIKNNKALVLLVLKYNNKDWLFVEYVQFLINDETVSIDFKKPTREVTLGGVYEYSAMYLDEVLFSKIEKILSANENVPMRFLGEKGIYDIGLQTSEITKLKEVLEFYRKIKI